MKTLRTMFATIAMIAVLSCSTVFADGILVAGLTDSSSTKTSTQQCTDTTVKVDSGILVAGFTGILVAGFTGILVAGFDGDTHVDCGILVAG